MCDTGLLSGKRIEGVKENLAREEEARVGSGHQRREQGALGDWTLSRKAPVGGADPPAWPTRQLQVSGGWHRAALGDSALCLSARLKWQHYAFCVSIRPGQRDRVTLQSSVA